MPNIVVVVDPTLIGAIDVTKGLVENGTIIANTDKQPEELGRRLGVRNARVCTVDAVRIALDILGRPIYNTAMLGALARGVKLVTLESINRVIRERFPGAVGEKNIAAIARAYEEAKIVG